MFGRSTECALLADFVSAIRLGQGRARVLRGEPGIGKSALLEYLGETAADALVLRATGVESEIELAFAGLHQLCGPLLDRVDELPAPRHDALQVVFGMRIGSPPDPFLVGWRY